jgi:hypothetical protein
MNHQPRRQQQTNLSCERKIWGDEFHWPFVGCSFQFTVHSSARIAAKAIL